MAYSPRFLAADRMVAGFEGGRVNHVADRGGDTAWGISRAAFPNVNPWPPTADQAQALRHDHYWLKCHCEALPELIALVVYDWAITSGEDDPAKALQAAIGIKVDGHIGPVTIAACKAHCGIPEAEQVLARELVRGRARQLTRLVRSGDAATAGSDPATFLGGWWDRTLRLMAAVDDAYMHDFDSRPLGPITGGE